MRTLSRYFYECIFTNVGDNNKNSKYNYLVLIVSKISAGELQMLSFSKKKKKKHYKCFLYLIIFVMSYELREGMRTSLATRP